MHIVTTGNRTKLIRYFAIIWPLISLLQGRLHKFIFLLVINVIIAAVVYKTASLFTQKTEEEKYVKLKTLKK